MMNFARPTPSKSPTPAKSVRPLGMPVRGPPKVSPSMLYSYSDTFDDSLSPKVVQYSDTFEESAPTKTRLYSNTFESEEAAYSYSDTFVEGTLATEQVDTRLSEDSYSQTLQHDTKPYSYTDTFDSSSSPLRGSATYTGTHTDKASWQSDDGYTRYESTDSEIQHSEDTYSEPTFTRRAESDEDTYSEPTFTRRAESDEDTYSERQSSDPDDDVTLGSDSYDYSYTFEEADTTKTEDPEKLRKEAELFKLAEESKTDFAADMMSRLRQKRIRQTDLSTLLTQGKQDKEKEMDWYTSRYLKKKLRLLKHKKSPTAMKSVGKPPHKSSGSKTPTVKEEGHLIQDYGIDPSLLDRLKLKNFIKRMETAAQEEIHDPRRCKDCRAHQLNIDAAAAQRNFVREKTRYIRQEIIEDRIQSHLIQMGSISLIGELARSLPNPLQDPEDVMEKMNKGLIFRGLGVIRTFE
ncbi:hypothetical protein KP79_PYT12872 [Mizuhopecten yessoensis]|uniref:Uncharacterized protein n=1 Tax=Mizuhopecten yessoensis TaxID=6573 RepID=A0A210QVW7_MIZYE|nr:hypothetical protein KP79_PYT12872 [Mizuhopecten yessoensis]